MAAYWKTAAHSVYDMFSKYKYLIVNLFFPSRFWIGHFFLIAPFLIIAFLYLSLDFYFLSYLRPTAYVGMVI